jgi:hypothetical protein
MGSSPGFGSNACHCVALVRLGFPAAPAVTALTLRHTLTRRFILQEARRHPVPAPCGAEHGAPTACKCTVSGTATPLIGVLLTFPSRYWFTIGRQTYLALRGGPRGFVPD